MNGMVMIEFEDLTSKEFDVLLEIEQKMKVTGGEITGTGFYFPTRTRDWVIREIKK